MMNISELTRIRRDHVGQEQERFCMQQQNQLGVGVFIFPDVVKYAHERIVQ